MSCGMGRFFFSGPALSFAKHFGSECAYSREESFLITFPGCFFVLEMMRIFGLFQLDFFRVSFFRDQLLQHQSKRPECRLGIDLTNSSQMNQKILYIDIASILLVRDDVVVRYVNPHGNALKVRLVSTLTKSTYPQPF